MGNKEVLGREDSSKNVHSRHVKIQYIIRYARSLLAPAGNVKNVSSANVPEHRKEQFTSIKEYTCPIPAYKPAGSRRKKNTYGGESGHKWMR
jgi:hypothetical protein